MVEREIIWETKSSQLDKSDFERINGVLLQFPDTNVRTSEKCEFLFLEQTGKKDWVISDPILKKPNAYETYSSNNPPKERKQDKLAEISIHESEMDEIVWYEVYIWGWNSYDDQIGIIVLSGFVEQDIEKLSERISTTFGFVLQ